jgi:hypothetical protein
MRPLPERKPTVSDKPSVRAALSSTEDLRIRHEPHVSCYIKITDLLGAHACHRSSAVSDEDTIPAPRVSVRERSQQTLIGVDACEQEGLLPALTQPLVHWELGTPKTAHARLVEANIVLCNVLLQRVVDVGVPRASEQAALSTLLFRKRGAQADVPSAALFVRHAFVEATGDGWRHNLQIVVRNAPVQPADLDPLLPAFFDHLDERLNGLDALAVVVENGVDKVVLHVDNDKQGGVGVNQDTAVVADAIVGVEGDLALAAARKIEAFGFRVVEPLVVSAWWVC